MISTRHTYRLALGVFAILVFGTALHARNEAEISYPIFQPVEVNVGHMAMGPEVALVQPIRVDLTTLAHRQVGDLLGLGLPPERFHLGRIDRVERRGPMRRTIAGLIEDAPGGRFTIVVYDDVAVGVIRFPAEKQLYQLHYQGDRVHLLKLINPDLYPPEQDPIVEDGVDCREGPEDNGPLMPPDEALPQEQTGCHPLPPVYDLLMVYTHLARQAMGGTNAAIAQCQLAVAVGNEAYVNSGINVRIRLVHTVETTYDEPGDQQQWLGWVRFFAPALRNEYACDFVSMLTAGGTGIGYCESGNPPGALAYSCAQFNRAVNTWTLVHEMGHNHTCNHNVEDAGDPVCAGSFGWHFWGNSGGHWGTVMSYEGTRIPYFSNPSIYYDGQPTGVTGEANNVQTHNSLIWFCEGYRLTRSDIWIQFNWHMNPNGTFNNPYNNIAEGLAAIPVGVGPSELPNLWIKSGATNETGTFDKPVVMRACGGTVHVGRVP